MCEDIINETVIEEKEEGVTYPNERKEAESTTVTLCDEYYIEPVKIIRDLVHGYVNLTRFELKLLDSAPLQRLKDIRQLTCQQVYPSARHTRFEHSLGVMELTRRAIDALNQNNYINNEKMNHKTKLISNNLKFNTVIAALLHDVGHCPFSHLGELQMDKMEVWDRLRRDIHQVIPDSSLNRRYKSSLYDKQPEKSAIHEQISCIIILEYYKKIFDSEACKMEKCNISINYDYILRCIMGVEYRSDEPNDPAYMIFYNSMIGLINSNIFDMDKLDYIMRDSQLTGIGTPIVDTRRLFKNMYFWDDGSIVFSSKAIPVLQNMIEARDNLYMYVYNHHTAVFSDFIYYYILRRLDHNARDFYNMMYCSIDFSILIKDLESDKCHIRAYGLLFKQTLFSLRALLKYNVSDSDLISTLNTIYSKLSAAANFTNLKGLIRKLVEIEKSRTKAISPGFPKNFQIPIKPNVSQIEQLAGQLQKTCDLINKLQSRSFLTPWWKTIFEYKLFMTANFIDDSSRKNLARLICDGSNSLVSASEFRSQIAKHVRYIMQKLHVMGYICAKLEDNDFFIVERPVKFFDITTINNISIALRSNQIVGMISLNGSPSYTQGYYRKFLSALIPQKDYFSFYGEHSFYIYSRNFSNEEEHRYSEEELHKFNTTVQQVFVFVAKEMMRRGEQDFASRFSCYNATREITSMEQMFCEFCSIFPNQGFSL